MKLPLQISFHSMDAVPEAEAAIQNQADRLDRYSDRVTSCRVVVEVPHRHHRYSDNLYQVRLDITLPGDEIAVTREASGHNVGKGVTATIQDAFDAAVRLLDGSVRH